MWSEATAFEEGLPAPSDRIVGLVFVKGGAGIDVCGGVVSSKSGASGIRNVAASLPCGATDSSVILGKLA